MTKLNNKNAQYYFRNKCQEWIVVQSENFEIIRLGKLYNIHLRLKLGAHFTSKAMKANKRSKATLDILGR